MEKVKSEALNDRQKMFVEHYLTNGMNATQAVISAGYSEKGARVKGSYLLANINIKNLIEKRQQKTQKKLEITRESLLLELQACKGACWKEQNYSIFIKTIEIQAKMLGLNEPDKLIISENNVKIIQNFGDRFDDSTTKTE